MAVDNKHFTFSDYQKLDFLFQTVFLLIALPILELL